MACACLSGRANKIPANSFIDCTAHFFSDDIVNIVKNLCCCLISTLHSKILLVINDVVEGPGWY